MKLFILVAIYKQKIKHSISLKSILKNDHLIRVLFSQVELLIYDNSPKPQNLGINLSFPITYYSDIKNGGLSTAYNYAYQLAKLQYDWVLFLDQDTELNESYFLELKRTMEKTNLNKEVVSIVPRIFYGKINFSPSMVKWGGVHRPVNKNITGEYNGGELMAIGSCTLLKISFINYIGGFSEIFWLDCLDRWIFKKIYDSQKKVYIMKSKIKHELSILNFNEFMTPDKYNNQILYESIFMLSYKSFGENIFFIVRLLRRAIYLLIETKDINYTKVSLLMIIRIITSNFNKQKILNNVE